MSRPAQYLGHKVEDYGCRIDLAWLRRQGVRTIGQSGKISWQEQGVVQASVCYTLVQTGLRLDYMTQGGGGPVAELIPIVTSPTQFGGRRHWFACPSCLRRCRIVYGTDRFLCRRCLGAQHQSQYQSQATNITTRRWRIRSKLEEREGATCPLGLDDGFPPKPPRMHWRTYRRLKACDKILDCRWNDWVHSRLQRIDPRLKKEDPFLAMLEAVTAPPSALDDDLALRDQLTNMQGHNVRSYAPADRAIVTPGQCLERRHCGLSRKSAWPRLPL